jgi:hypothetical protein
MVMEDLTALGPLYMDKIENMFTLEQRGVKVWLYSLISALDGVR